MSQEELISVSGNHQEDTGVLTYDIERLELLEVIMALGRGELTWEKANMSHKIERTLMRSFPKASPPLKSSLLIKSIHSSYSLVARGEFL